MQGEQDLSDRGISVGHSWTGHPVRMDRDGIMAFARAYDPQPMHTEEHSESAAAFGGIIASGWHVAALTMRDMVETSPFGSAPILGMGVDDLRWLKPVMPGDTLTATRIVEELRLSKSRPDRRIVTLSTTVRNQNDETVMRFSTTIQLPASPATPESASRP